MAVDEVDSERSAGGSRALTAAVAALALLTSVYASAYLAVNSDALRQRVGDALHAGLGGSFAVGELVVDADLATIHLYDATIAVDSGSSPVIEADEAHAELAPTELLSGRVVFPRGRARGATVRLVFDEEGGLNLRESLGIEPSQKKGRPSRPFPIVFQHIETWNSRFEFVRPEFEFTVPDVDVPHARIAILERHLEMEVDRLDVPEARFRFFPRLFGFPSSYGAWTFTVEEIRVRDWRWRDRSFTTESLRLRAEGVSARASGEMAFGAGGVGEDQGDPRMSYSGRARVSLPYWSPLVQYFVRDTVHSRAPTVDVAVEGDLEVIDGLARVRADVLDAAGLTFTDLRAAITLRQQFLLLRQGRARFNGGRVVAESAYFDMFDVAYGGRGRIDGVNPAAVLRDLGGGGRGLDGELSGEFRAHGAVPMGRDYEVGDPYPTLTDARRDLLDLVTTGDWTFRPARSLPGPAGSLRLDEGARIRADYERVAVPGATFRGGGMTLNVEHLSLDYGEMAFWRPGDGPPVDLRLRIAQIAPFAAALGAPGLGGALSVSLTASGPVTAPEARLRAVVDSPVWRSGGGGVEGRRIRLDGRATDGRFDLSRLSVETEGGTLAAEGSVRFADSGGGLRSFDDVSLDLDYRARAVELSVLDSLSTTRLRLRGTVTGDGTLEGTVGRPSGSVGLEVAAGSVLGVPVTDLVVEAGLDGGKLRLERCEGELLERADLRASASYALGSRRFRADLSIEGLELSGLFDRLRLPGGDPVGLPEGASPEGTVQVDISGEGTPREPSLGGDLDVRGLRAMGVEVGDAALVGYTRDGELHISGAFLPLAAIRAHVPIGDDGRYRASVGFRQVDLAAIPGLFESVDMVQRLQISGSVEVVAGSDLADYKAVAELESVRLETADASFVNRGPIVASLDHRGLLHVERATLGAGESFVDIEGGVMLDSGLVDVRVRGDVRLELADVAGRYLLPETWPGAVADTEGRASVDLTVAGPPSRPTPRGTVTVGRARVALRDVARPVTLESGRIRFAEDGIAIDEDRPLVGQLLGGYTQVTGEIGIEEHRLSGGRLSVWSHGMSYRIPGMVDVSFDPDVEVAIGDVYDPSTWRVTGAVDVLTARYYRDISIFEEQFTGRVVGAFRQRTDEYRASMLETQPWIGEIEFDLDVRASDGVRIDNRIDRFVLALELRIDLRLRGRLADPSLTGEIEVVDGTVAFQGETFEVRNGTFEYTGAPANPLVAVTAGADIQNRCAELETRDRIGSEFEVMGDFDGDRREVYRILLRAEGRLDNLDVRFESNPFADQRDVLSLMLTGCTVDSLTASDATSPTIEVALGPLLGRIERQVREVVALSEFTITPGVERTRVRLGDRISRRLHWNLELDTGPSEEAAEQEYRLEYRLNDFWTAEASERTRGINRELLLDLKLEYRLPLD